MYPLTCEQVSEFPFWLGTVCGECVSYVKSEIQKKRHLARTAPPMLPPWVPRHSISFCVFCRFQVDPSCFSWSYREFSTVFEARHRVINTAVKSLLLTSQKWACPVRQDVARSLAGLYLLLLYCPYFIFSFSSGGSVCPTRAANSAHAENTHIQ